MKSVVKTQIPRSTVNSSRKISIAPMMDYTDRHFRYFLRLISRRVLLYSEMVTTSALLDGDRDRLLKFDSFEKPVAFQLGGSHVKQLGHCSEMVEDSGYDEVNLNVGCPSNRVRNGRFGACLMAEPELVADCIQEMNQRVSIPVTVKSRIGIDRNDSYEALTRFVSTVSDAGCKVFIFHARKALLNGFSPKQNRNIPPLQYDRVYQVKRDFPKLTIIINGGITNLNQVDKHLKSVDGVMIGREAHNNPYFLAQVDQRFFNDGHEVPSRREVLVNYLPYIESQLNDRVKPRRLTRHLAGLFHSVQGARHWRRFLGECASSAASFRDQLSDAAAQATS